MSPGCTALRCRGVLCSPPRSCCLSLRTPYRFSRHNLRQCCIEARQSWRMTRERSFEKNRTKVRLSRTMLRSKRGCSRSYARNRPPGSRRQASTARGRGSWFPYSRCSIPRLLCSSYIKVRFSYRRKKKIWRMRQRRKRREKMTRRSPKRIHPKIRRRILHWMIHPKIRRYSTTSLSPPLNLLLHRRNPLRCTALLQADRHQDPANSCHRTIPTIGKHRGRVLRTPMHRKC